MGTVKRLARRRRDCPESLEAAWDAGLLPPREASLSLNHDLVVDCIFFRWADTGRWPRCEHPHFRAWLASL